MELMYPIVIIICLILSVILFFVKFRNKTKYTSGTKVANTKYIKETEYYKLKVKKYKILSNIIKSLTAICIVMASVLVARIVTVQTKSEDKYNRDILIGLDISTSQCEVNLELVRKFKQIIPDIKGDRIGIVLYNTAPVVYCPLTDDYDYVNECFSKIEEQLVAVVKNNGNIPSLYDDNGTEAFTFWYGGTVASSDVRGSSLVGDGLAGTVFSFPNLKTDNKRTRIIIFATDNDVSGTQTVTLEEACNICKEYNINLYAYCPTVEMNTYTSKDKIASYKNAVEQNAKGQFYTGDLDKMSTNIVNEIKKTKNSLLKTSKKTYVTDYPQIPFISVLVVFLVLIIMEKRAKV